MLPVTIQHRDGVTYHFYNAEDACNRKGSRVIFSKIDESKASRFLRLFSFEDLSKIYKILPKKDLEKAFPKKYIMNALTAGTLVVYEESTANGDVDETEVALLRLEIKMILNQILNIEIAEAADIEKSLENKNAVQKILLYKKEYDKGFIDGGIEFLTWIKDIYEVVSPTENLKRAIDAGWETYKADSPEWKQLFADKLKASNYKEVVDALGFDPGMLSTEQMVEVFESAKLIYDDEKTQQIILKFIRDYAGAQHSLEWANFIGSAVFDIVLTALLAVATGGAGAVASVGSKAGRLMKPLANLGEKFSELAKKLSKKFKPKKRKKTKVGGKASKNGGDADKKNKGNGEGAADDSKNESKNQIKTNPEDIREASKAWPPDKKNRFDKADQYYKDSGYEDYDSHLRGIDFDKPVEVVDINEGEKLYQYSYLDRVTGKPKVGSYYYGNENVNPNKLGFDIEGRKMIEVETAESGSYLQSSAANIEDWNGSGKVFEGGETQLFNPNIESMNIKVIK